MCVALALASIYVAAEELKKPALRRRTGKASWYGDAYRGKVMANGEVYDPDALTCATWDWPLGTELVIRSVDTGRSVRVLVTDRGPARLWRFRDRVVDLSKAAFEEICPSSHGLTDVEVTLWQEAEAAP